MRRLFWISVGVGVTVYAMSKGRKIVKHYAPEAVVDRVSAQASTFTAAATDAAGGFFSDFKSAFTEREQELREALLAESQGSVDDLRAKRDAYKRNSARPSGPAASAADYPDIDPEEQELGYSF